MRKPVAQIHAVHFDDGSTDFSIESAAGPAAVCLMLRVVEKAVDSTINLPPGQGVTMTKEQISEALRKIANGAGKKP